MGKPLAYGKIKGCRLIYSGHKGRNPSTTVSIGVILGLYWDSGKQNGNYYLGFRVRVSGLGPSWYTV